MQFRLERSRIDKRDLSWTTFAEWRKQVTVWIDEARDQVSRVFAPLQLIFQGETSLQ